MTTTHRMTPYEIRLECFNNAMKILVERHKEQDTNYPTTTEILEYARQINDFVSYPLKDSPLT